MSPMFESTLTNFLYAYVMEDKLAPGQGRKKLQVAVCSFFLLLAMHPAVPTK